MTGTLPVDPLFKEFYQALGGQAVLGPVLTGLVEREARKCQFTEAVLMCFNPSEAESSRQYRLEPLGYGLQVQDDPQLPVPPGAGSRDLGGGFRLYDEFASLYERIYGDLYAGRPLTQVRANLETGRYEQFFENVGFYRDFNAAPGDVHLLPYGAYQCEPGCAARSEEYWKIVRSGRITQLFELTLSSAVRAGLGRPIAQPRMAEDGMFEQVYENAILYASPDDLAHIHLRPLVTWLNFVAVQPPVEKNPHEQLIFYETENGLGHNVPLFFDAFIGSLGGREQAGQPITEIFPENNGSIYRQCFENLCLDYNPAAPEGARVSLAGLGWLWLQQRDPGAVALKRFTPETVQLSLEERSPQVARGEQQQVSLLVLDRATGEPMGWVAGRLSLNLPDRPALELAVPPTGPDGRASVDLPPLDGLENMSVVEYRVCLELPDDPQVCAVDSFVYRGE